MKTLLITTVTCLFLSSLVPENWADTAVIPASAKDIDSPSAAVSLFPADQVRYQFLYRSEDLVTLMPEGGRISGLAFRNDAEVGAAGSTVIQDVEIRMGTTPSLSPLLSVEFAKNIGPDYKVVFQRGQLPLSSGYIPGQVNPFDWKIPLTSEFEYYAGNGHLLIDFFVYSNNKTPPGIGVDMAAPIGRVGSISGSTHEGSVIGSRESGGPVLQITFAPIPEPTSFAIFMIAGCMVCFIRRYKA